MARVISDAGPLIALAKLDSLFVPRDLFTRIRIPEAVWLECVRKPGTDSRRIEQAASEGWFDVDDDRQTVRVLAVFVGRQDHVRHMLARLLEE